MQQPLSNGLYVKPETLNTSDAYIVDLQHSDEDGGSHWRRYAVLTLKLVDEAGSLRSEDLAVAMFHIRPKKGLLWQVDPSLSGHGDIPHQIGKMLLATKLTAGLGKLTSLLGVIPPHPHDTSESA